MAAFGLMFHVQEGGVSVPIQWKAENLTDDRSIIVLDESNQIIWLWHGSKQGLVARRTALRQAQSLKGHGYTIGKSIIGRDIKEIKEIDQRKIGREPNTDNINKEFQVVLDKKVKMPNSIKEIAYLMINDFKDLNEEESKVLSEIFTVQTIRDLANVDYRLLFKKLAYLEDSLALFQRQKQKWKDNFAAVM